MRRIAICLPGLLVSMACAPATGGLGDGSDADTGDTEAGDGDGDGDAGDGDGDAGDGDGDAGDGDGDMGDGDGDMGDGDGEPACTELGCECDGSPGSCDLGLSCEDGTCVEDPCGDMSVDEGEECDDGNGVDFDGCDNDCSYTTLSVHAGGQHSCALIEGGAVRCWGLAALGQLGYGDNVDVGDDESPAEAGDVPLIGGVVQLELGDFYTCGRFEDDQTRCWGAGSGGQLGYADTANLGDDEGLGDQVGVMLGGNATRIDAGQLHTCALLEDTSVRCWGTSNDGELGYGDTDTIGDDEHPVAAGPVGFGNGVSMTLLALGFEHSCALSTADELYCWGKNNRGQLGLGSNADYGDGEDPTMPVDVYPQGLQNSTITSMALGKEHSCVLFSTGQVLCWGRNDQDQLGDPNGVDWGDGADEFPSALAPVELGGAATQISAGEKFTCALLDDGAVRCWGHNDKGQLGLGVGGNVGDDELPSEVDPVMLGGPARSVSAGNKHACAVLEDYSVLCWGEGASGRLGYGDVELVGDDETPMDKGPVSVL